MGNYNFNGKNILVVDDDVISVFATKMYLQRTGADIFSANNGEDAVKLVSNRHIDLILMNIQMPIMSGFETTSKIRQFNKNVPIIAYTAMNINDVKEQDRLSEFNDYLRKPVMQEAMLSTIDKYL